MESLKQLLSNAFKGFIPCRIFPQRLSDSPYFALSITLNWIRSAHFIPAALLFVAGYAGCQALGAAWLGIAALLVSGTAPAGALAAIADLAPAESPACAAAACALCSTLGAAGLLAANYFVTQALHGSVSRNYYYAGRGHARYPPAQM